MAEKTTMSSSLKHKILLEPEGIAGKDVVLLALYSKTGATTTAVHGLVKLLSDQGFCIIVCMATDRSTEDVINCDIPFASGIIVRQNGGMDFSSWSCILRLFPECWNATRLIFTNDSVFMLPKLAPAFFARLRGASSDFVALTDSNEFKYHTQSYFFMLNGFGLRSEKIHRFWDNIIVLDRKNDVILKYELELFDTFTKLFSLSHEVLFSLEVLFGQRAASDLGQINVTHQFWEYLIHHGFPFVKADLLRENPNRMNIQHWRGICKSYGADIAAIEEQLMIRGYNQSTSATHKNYKNRSEFSLFLSKINRARLLWRRKRKLNSQEFGRTIMRAYTDWQIRRALKKMSQNEKQY